VLEQKLHDMVHDIDGYISQCFLRVVAWACPNLTDSGLKVKKTGSPHEDTVIQTDSPQGELYRSIQAGGT